MGRYRDLTDAEIKELNELIEPSSGKKLVYREPKLLKGEQNSSKGRSQVQEKKEIIKIQDLLSLVSKKLFRHLIMNSVLSLSV
jgi:uncharacterized membrane protein YcjF (UPF0283 family)